TLPAERSKTKTEIVRPLSKAAQAVLAAQPRGIGDYVFTPGAAPLRNFSDAKRKLDAVSGLSGYQLHDLRRTSRSLLSRAGINSDIAERCLGHALPAIRATYDRHHFLDEMAHAFQALAALIERIVNPTDAAVIAFRRWAMAGGRKDGPRAWTKGDRDDVWRLWHATGDNREEFDRRVDAELRGPKHERKRGRPPNTFFT